MEKIFAIISDKNIVKGKPIHHYLDIQSSPLDFKRGYIRALFLENERWINCIEKHWMIVSGLRTNRLDNRRDLALKEKLANQVHPDTYLERREYYVAWMNVKCCADDCDRYCDECHGIQFEPVPSRIARVFDPDVRWFIEKYQRFWLTSEQDKALKDIREGFVYGDGREVSNQKDGNDAVRYSGRKGIRRSGEREEDSGNPRGSLPVVSVTTLFVHLGNISAAVCIGIFP